MTAEDEAIAAAEAQAAEAEALAAAAEARAEAIRLRRLADESRAALAAAETPAEAPVETPEAGVPDGDVVEAEPLDIDAVDTDDDDDDDESVDHDADLDDDDASSEAGGWRQWVPGWRLVTAGVAVIVLATLLSASAYLIVKHQQATEREQRAEAFSTGARQGVVNLMSLNFNTGQADLQRVMDSTTGSFHDDFEKSAKDFLTVMKDAKVVTTTTVSATGIESMTNDSAVVLVAATSQVANTASQQPSPRAWRLAVTVNKENGQIKMSKVEFVP